MSKRRFLGLSFPVLIGISIVLLALTVISFLSGALGNSLIGDVGLPSWLTVPKPHVELPADTVFHLFGFPITNTIIASWLSIIVLVGLAYAVTHRTKLIPSRLQSLLEFAIEWMFNLCKDVAGEKNGRRFFPIVTTIFLFVLMNAWLSLLPGFGSILVTGAEGEPVHILRGANTDINMPLALALISFAFVEYFGLRSQGFLYLRKFFNVKPFFRGVGQLFIGKFQAGLGGIFRGGIDIFVSVLDGLCQYVRWRDTDINDAIPCPVDISHSFLWS